MAILPDLSKSSWNTEIFACEHESTSMFKIYPVLREVAMLRSHKQRKTLCQIDCV